MQGPPLGLTGICLGGELVHKRAVWIFPRLAFAWVGNLCISCSTFQKGVPNTRGCTMAHRSPVPGTEPVSSRTPVPATANAIATASLRPSLRVPCTKSNRGQTTTAREQRKEEVEASAPPLARLNGGPCFWMFPRFGCSLGMCASQKIVLPSTNRPLDRGRLLCAGRLEKAGGAQWMLL